MAEWYLMARARRQALAQKTQTAHEVQKELDRSQRRLRALSETVDVIR